MKARRAARLAGLLLWLGFGLVVSGCGKQSSVNKPPEIAFGMDACDECRMIINEARFAAAFRDKEGKAYRFDDIGCMLQYLKKHPVEPAGLWVKDYRTEAWLPFVGAWFVESKELPTPMAYGIVALADSTEASKIASQFHGRQLNSRQLLSEANITLRETMEEVQ
ncbi:MAG: hypothetical protein D6715_09805 [Calditrichaeota bacterium]|nr:MAG: hypothetical protein D6715_09805 [Calditrichota bacterium]